MLVESCLTAELSELSRLPYCSRALPLLSRGNAFRQSAVAVQNSADEGLDEPRA